MIFTLGLLAAGAVGVAWYVSTYNGLVGARNAVDQAWSNVEVELKRRLDLIGNLVETVKGYATHEKQVFEEVAALRSGRVSNAADANAAEQQTTRLLGKLFAVAEAYPELKADTQFKDLQLELARTEDRIAERRLAYNATVNYYNTRCQTVPSNLPASLHGFQLKTFFDAPPEADQAPRVTFS